MTYCAFFLNLFLPSNFISFGVAPSYLPYLKSRVWRIGSRRRVWTLQFPRLSLLRL